MNSGKEYVNTVDGSRGTKRRVERDGGKEITKEEAVCLTKGREMN